MTKLWIALWYKRHQIAATIVLVVAYVSASYVLGHFIRKYW